MRRIVFTTAASIVVIALAPAGAMARSHHKRHHSRTHHARVRIRHERFGNLTMPTTPTTTPTTPTPPPADSVATVTSFTGGVLTITLNNGSTVSGMVTNATEIECEASQAMGSDVARRSSDGGPGGDNQGSGGGDNQGSSGGDNQGSGDENQGQDNDD